MHMNASAVRSKHGELHTGGGPERQERGGEGAQGHGADHINWGHTVLL